MTRQAFGEGTLVTPEALPGSPVERASALASLGEAEAARSPGADVIVGGRSVLVLPGATTWEGPARRARETHPIDVVYDGPDVDAVASACGLSRDAVIQRHSSVRYVALLTGFMPGFAYLGEVDPALVLPRLAQPRKRVPAGAVGIAGALTGVYPFASPGGWNLLGTAQDAALFDPGRSPPARVGVLDEVIFRPVEARSAALESVLNAPAAGSRALVVESVRGLATVQDRGRFGLRGRGVAWSGPLDSETLDAANAALGNAPRAAAIEVVMAKTELRADSPLWVSVDGAPARKVAAGERFTADPGERLTAYVAVEGGVDVPEVLGSRSTFLLARFGGFAGRGLRRGDRLGVGALAARSAAARALAPSGPLRVTRAPADDRLAPGAFEALLGSRFTVSQTLDRVGVRLDGERIGRLPEDRSLPDPSLPGAIQITNDGTPIVLGPDCAVTGGYPVVALLDGPSRAVLGRSKPGNVVTFREA